MIQSSIVLIAYTDIQRIRNGLVPLRGCKEADSKSVGYNGVRHGEATGQTAARPLLGRLPHQGHAREAGLVAVSWRLMQAHDDVGQADKPQSCDDDGRPDEDCEDGQGALPALDFAVLDDRHGLEGYRLGVRGAILVMGCRAHASAAAAREAVDVQHGFVVAEFTHDP